MLESFGMTQFVVSPTHKVSVVINYVAACDHVQPILPTDTNAQKETETSKLQEYNVLMVCANWGVIRARVSDTYQNFSPAPNYHPGELCSAEGMGLAGSKKQSVSRICTKLEYFE